MPNGNGVTWRGVLLVCGGVIAIGVNVTMAVMHLHSQHPHQHAVTHSEFQLYKEKIDETVRRFDENVEEIKEEIKLIRQEKE